MSMRIRSRIMTLFAVLAALAMTAAAPAQAKQPRLTSNVSMFYEHIQGHANRGVNAFDGTNWVACKSCGRITTGRDARGRFHRLKLTKSQTLVGATVTYAGEDTQLNQNWNGKGHLPEYKSIVVDGKIIEMRFVLVSVSVYDARFPTPSLDGCRVSCGK
jgi:hypothetical protein